MMNHEVRDQKTTIDDFHKQKATQLIRENRQLIKNRLD